VFIWTRLNPHVFLTITFPRGNLTTVMFCSGSRFLPPSSYIWVFGRFFSFQFRRVWIPALESFMTPFASLLFSIDPLPGPDSLLVFSYVLPADIPFPAKRFGLVLFSGHLYRLKVVERQFSVAILGTLVRGGLLGDSPTPKVWNCTCLSLLLFLRWLFEAAPITGAGLIAFLDDLPLLIFGNRL